MIYILTGNVRTGKTTALLNWSEKRNDVDGILCPDNEDGKRYFLEVKSREQFPHEVELTSEHNIISVGPFQFLKSAFLKANNYLKASAEKKNFRYLIIDELGKLELKNEGLHDSAESLIKNHESNETQNLILVVRASLLDKIKSHYNISKCILLDKESLNELD